MEQKHKKYNEVRLRFGAVDDIAIDEGDLHFEQMTDNSWWLGFYQGDKRITFWIHSETSIQVKLNENGIKAKLIEQEGR